MINSKKILILHNIIAPYRIPLFNRLNEKYQITVYFCKTKTKERKWNHSNKDFNFKFKILPVFDIGPFFFNYTIFFEMMKNKYDIYLVSDDYPIVLSTLITYFFSKIYKKKFIIWSESIDNRYIKNKKSKFSKKILIKLLDSFIKLYRKYIYKNTDFFIGYSNKAKQYLLNFRIPKEKIIYGIQVLPKELLIQPNKNKINSKYKDKTIILYLGYLRENKGIGDLINSFKILNKKDTLLLIVGSGSDESRLKELSNDNENICFIGYLDGIDKANIYNFADIFVLPTLYDAWGLTINEAMFYGLPVITTDAAGASELIEKANNGFIIKPNNPISLSEHIEILLSKEQIRKDMAKKSCQFIDAFDVDVGIKPFDIAIKNALGELHK